MAITRTIIVLVIFLMVLAATFLLQIFLSTRRSKWPGLVLPGLSLVWGLLFAVNATDLPIALTAFLLAGGVPCLIHLAIYRAGRERSRQRNRDQVEKMNIQDLG